MRYFRLFDELSEDGGDLYRWDGSDLRMKMQSGKWSDFASILAPCETVEELLQSLAGNWGRFEEVEGE